MPETPDRPTTPGPSGQAEIDHSVTLTVLDPLVDAVNRNARSLDALNNTQHAILDEMRAQRLAKQKRAGRVPTDAFGEPLCPKCNEEMVLRKPRDGGKFWGCVAYPDCKGARPLDFDPITPEPKAPGPQAPPSEVVDL